MPHGWISWELKKIWDQIPTKKSPWDFENQIINIIVKFSNATCDNLEWLNMIPLKMF